MKLKGPNKADKAKLHLEVNQLVNQRFLLTTLAVTIFGVMVAWTLPEPSVNDVKTSGSPIGAYRLSLTALLQVTLFLIFLLGHNLSKMLRILTTYLEVTKKSNWERDWCRYRTSPYMGYTKPQSIVFLALGVFTTSIPLLLPLVFPFVLEPLPGVLAVLALGVIYLVLVGGMGFRGWFSSERAIRSRWVALKKKGDSYRDKAAPPIASDAQPPLEEDKRQERTRLLLELLGTESSAWRGWLADLCRGLSEGYATQGRLLSRRVQARRRLASDRSSPRSSRRSSRSVGDRNDLQRREQQTPVGW